MNGRASGLALNADSLRERNAPVRARTEDDARKTVLELNAHEERTQKDEQNRKTYGRTPEGIGLSLPTTSGKISIASASGSCPCQCIY
jgi:phosphatidylethanolamine N-methyltransferase